MEPLILLIEPELDERAATATMTRAKKVYEEGARDISRVMRSQLTEGTTAAGRGFEELETKARKAYLGMQDAGEKVAAAERKFEAAKERGAANAETLARRVERARLSEIDAIEKATQAYREYENAAQGAGEAATTGLRGAAGAALGAGREAADGFMSGFAGASALARLGAAGGPIGIALAATAALGFTAGKVLADNIAAGLQSLAIKDVFQARLGVDDATMARFGQSAANAFTDMWGTSIEDNLRAVQFAVQGGVISPDSSDAEVEQTIAQMQTLATVMGVDVQEAARASGQLMRGGFAQDGQQAADIIASGFQRGLDIAGDWLDTITEYTTQFRKLGLDGDDALGLIQQGLEGGARDSDKVADSLKEFSIRAVDGSKLTAEGFAALGFSADEMAAKFLAGGDTARGAFGATLDAIKSLDDPIQQALVWQSLFGTQWEDMGDAINSMDLSTARTEFGSTEGAIDSATNKLSQHVDGWDQLGRHIDQTFTKLKEWLADSAIGRFFSQDLPDILSIPFGGGPPGHGPASYTNPNAAAPIPLSPSDVASATVPGLPGGGAPVRNGPGDLLMPSLGGPRVPAGNIPAAPPAPGDTPAPGQRTPMLTDTQKEAQDAAGGGKSLPPAPVLPLQYRSTAGLPSNVASAMNRQDEVEHNVAEKQARLNQLKSSNVATAEDIQKAENDLTKAENDRLKAQQSLVDAQTSAAEKQAKSLKSTTNALSELGAGLDSDFGISKGLAGILDNLVRFVGSLALAGPMAQMSAIAAANPNEGSGLMGALAARGVFGPQFTPGAISAANASNMGPAALRPGLSGPAFAAQPGQSARDFAHNTMMPFWQSLGLTVGDHAADAFGEHQNGALDIMVPDLATGNQVLQQALSDPNVYGAIFNQRSYGYGRGPGGTLMGDRGSPTQNHMDHVHVFYKPGGGNNIVPGGATVPSIPTPGSSPGASGPGWFPPLPPGLTGGGGESPVFGTQPLAPAPGAGGMLGGALGQNVFPTPGIGGALGGQPFPASPGGGGLGVNGMAMDGLMAATTGLDVMMPGAGSLAKMGIQVANRTIKFAGQQAGNLANFWLSALTPAGDNPKASIGNSWFGKIVGGLAQAKPATPNPSGGKQPPGPLGGPGGQQGPAPAQAGNTVNFNQTNNRVSEETATNSAIRELSAANFPNPGHQ